MKISSVEFTVSAMYRYLRNVRFFGKKNAEIKLGIKGSPSNSNNRLYDSAGNAVGTITPGGWGSYGTYYSCCAINGVGVGEAYITNSYGTWRLDFDVPLDIESFSFNANCHPSYTSKPDMVVRVYSDSGSIAYEETIALTGTAADYEHSFAPPKLIVVKRGDRYFVRPKTSVVLQLMPYAVGASLYGGCFSVQNMRFLDESGAVKWTVSDVVRVSDKEATFKLGGIEGVATFASTPYGGATYQVANAFSTTAAVFTLSKNDSQVLGTENCGIRFKLARDPGIRGMKWVNWVDYDYTATDFGILVDGREVYRGQVTSRTAETTARWQ